MNTRNDTGFKTFLVGVGGVVRFTRVKLDTGTIVTAGAGEDAIGVVLDTAAAGACSSVKMFSAPGTQAIVAAGTFALNATIYGAADGKIDDVVSGNKIGIAVEACTVAGQVIEIIPAGVAELFAVQALIADVAAMAAATAVAPAALTSPAAGAGSGADATTFNGAQCDALRADVLAVRAEVVKLVTDHAATVTRLGLDLTAINAALAALKANGIILSA